MPLSIAGSEGCIFILGATRQIFEKRGIKFIRPSCLWMRALKIWYYQHFLTKRLSFAKTLLQRLCYSQHSVEWHDELGKISHHGVVANYKFVNQSLQTVRLHTQYFSQYSLLCAKNRIPGLESNVVSINAYRGMEVWLQSFLTRTQGRFPPCTQ